MDAKISKEQLLSTAPVNSAILKMAIPAILAMLVNALYNFVDTFYIGMLGDTNALSAVGIAFPIFMLIIAFGQLLGVGAATTIGRQLGSKDKDGASKTATTVVALSFIVAIFFTGVGLIFIRPIFRLFGASEAVLPYALDYGKWMFLAALVEVPNQCFNSIARAETSTKTAAFSLIIGAVTNIILDPIFMFTFNMGIEGAALATALSQVVCFSFIASYFFTGKSIVEVKRKNFKLSKDLLVNIFSSGTPVFVSQVLMSVSVAITNIMAGTLLRGDDIIAAYSVVLKVVVIGQYLLFGFMQGYQPIAAYSYGAKDHKRFTDSFKYTIKTCSILCIIVTVVYLLFNHQLIKLFNTDPFVIEVGGKILISNIILFVLAGFVVLLTTMYQAIGMGRSGIIVSSLRQGLAYIPLVFILVPIIGIWGLYLAQPIADIISFIIAMFMKKDVFKKIEQQFAS